MWNQLLQFLLVRQDIATTGLGGAVVERWTRDRKVAGSTPGRGAIKSTRSTQPSIPSSTGLHDWGLSRGVFTCVG